MGGTTYQSRLGALALSATLSATAAAQFDPSVIGTVQALKDQNVIRTPVALPTQPTGFPNPPPKRSTESDAGQAFGYDADQVEQNGDDFILRGNVELVGRGYRVRCDEATGNRRTQIATASGHVLITGNNQSIIADRVTVDFIHENYVAEHFNTEVPPDQLGNGVTGTTYVSGKLSSGTQYLTHTQDGIFTSCPLDKPHFDITGRDVEIRTGKRAILRDAKFQLFGKTIFQLPFLVIPLDDYTYRYTPYVGKTPDEGYFIKNTTGVPVGRNDVLLVQTDEMQKLGTGLGAQYGYARPALSGVLKVYKIFGSASDEDYSLQHRQVFRNGSISLDDDYQKDNHLVAPGQTLNNLRGTLTLNNLGARTIERATTRLTLARNTSEASSSTGTDTSSSYSNVNQATGLSDQRRIGNLRTDVQLDLLQTSSSLESTTSAGTTNTDSQTERLQTKILASQSVGAVDASINYQRTVPVGSTSSNSLGSNDITPAFDLSSDSTKLFGKEFGKEVPLKFDASWGEYVDTRNSTSTERTAFGFSYAKSSPSQERLTFDTNTNFRQGIYSDDTAQYILGLNENIRYKLGSDTGLNLRYGYLRPYGYTPLSIDNTGQTNYFSTDLNARPIRPVLLGVQTGYDLVRLKNNQIAWQQVGIRSEWTPRQGILVRGLYTYDTYQQVFSQLRFDASFFGKETRATLNAQYDGVRHTWSTFNGQLDGLRVGRTKIAAIFSYNGYLKKFESKQYAFTYDLHCAEAVLAVQENDYGFRPGRQIQLLIRLKALPFELPFGTGTRGQGVGYGSGTNF